MVVLRPLLEGERTRTCKCGHIGLTSPIPERSSFYPCRSDDRTRFQARCRRCSVGRGQDRLITDEERAKYRVNYARRAANLTDEEREEQRRKWRERKRRQMERDPKGERAKRSRVQKAASERRLDKLGPKGVREIRRIDRVVRRERNQGKALPPLKEIISTTASSHEKLPIGPFRAWLRYLMEKAPDQEKPNGNTKPYGFVATQLGTSSRRFYSWMNEYKVVDYCTVDRAASREGATTVEEIYRVFGNITLKEMSDSRNGDSLAFIIYHWSPTEKEREMQAVAVKVGSCRSPGCDTTVKEGSRFCVEHNEAFERVRMLMQSETEAFRGTIKRKGMRSTCCNPACRAPRLASERYCDACVEEGWREEDLS